jgi:hypothetical protein
VSSDPLVELGWVQPFHSRVHMVRGFRTGVPHSKCMDATICPATHGGPSPERCHCMFWKLHKQHGITNLLLLAHALGDMGTCELSLLCNAKRAWRPCALPALLAVTDTVAALVFQNLLWRCRCGGELRGVRRAAVPSWPMPNLTHTEAFFGVEPPSSGGPC